ncbi:MAG: Cerebroside-sulfatase, partial [Candidatus Heritagella sp.]
IDGIDCSDLLFQDVPSPRKEFFYYFKEALECVRAGDWKLHVAKEEKPLQALYNLREDIGETHNVYEEHPEIVQALSEKLAVCRKELGDSLLSVRGEGVRPIGRVDNPKPLAEYKEDHPYIVMMYDREEIG